LDLLHRLALARVPGVGGVLFRKLVGQMGSPEAVFAADTARLRQVSGVGERTARAIKSYDGWPEVEAEIERMRELDVRLLPLEDAGYPVNLREIHDPPVHLYVRGEILARDALAMAVVGSRNASPYGSKVTRKLAANMARAGVTVVSGMARGIDSFAHRGALGAGGRTIAVLGCGVDVVFPRSNADLVEEIAASGAVVSEFPLGTEPRPENFPKRNRIISGLSLGVLLVEAGAKSGALITASCALDQGRDVFAVPGSVEDPRNAGSHWLIKQGARIVDSAGDVLREILPQDRSGGERGRPAAAAGLTEEERRVLTKMDSDPIHIDDIVRRTGMPVSRLSGILLSFELRGLVEQLPGKLFRRTVEG